MQIVVVKDFTFGFDYKDGDSDDDDDGDDDTGVQWWWWWWWCYRCTVMMMLQVYSDDDDVTGVQILQPHNVHAAGVHSSHHFYGCGLLQGMDIGRCLPSE